MFNRIWVTVTVATFLVVPSSLLGDDLSFGSAAPQFAASMLRGEPLSELSHGKVYVIEFGGTKCVPCIKLIPEMNRLQEQYPDVIFVSIFCEPLDAVRLFMEGPGKNMRVRVAIDSSGHMKKQWLDAGGLQAVPQAFIVDRSGCIAWFGYADGENFVEALQAVVDGIYDIRLEQIRMELTRTLEEYRRNEIHWVEKVNEVIRKAHECATPQESIALLDNAMVDFAGSPERITLSIMKLHYYQTVPESREKAYKHALSLAVDAIHERNPNHYVSACESMLRHSERALPENRDSRMADLALAVLLDDTAPTNHRTLHPELATQYRVKRLVAIANARRIRGDLPLALNQLNEAISVLRTENLNEKPEWFLDEHNRFLKTLESKATSWQSAVTPQTPQVPK